MLSVEDEAKMYETQFVIDREALALWTTIPRNWKPGWKTSTTIKKKYKIIKWLFNS